MAITAVDASIDVNVRKKFVVTLKNVSAEDHHMEIKEIFILWNKDSIVPSFRVPVTLKKSNLDHYFCCDLEHHEVYLFSVFSFSASFN